MRAVAKLKAYVGRLGACANANFCTGMPTIVFCTRALLCDNAQCQALRGML